jgi:hypothetical protein
VTERQAEIDGERNQREPRTTPDMVTKPAHHSLAEIVLNLPGKPSLADVSKRSTGHPNTLPRRFGKLRSGLSHLRPGSWRSR